MPPIQNSRSENQPIGVVAHRVRPRGAPQLSQAQSRFMREMRSDPGPLQDVAKRANVTMLQVSGWMRSANFLFHLKRFARELNVASKLERKIGRAKARTMIQRIANGDLKQVSPVRLRACAITTSADPAPRDSDGRFLQRPKSARRTNATSSAGEAAPHNPFHPSVSPEEAREYMGGS